MLPVEWTVEGELICLAPSAYENLAKNMAAVKAAIQQKNEQLKFMRECKL